MRRALPTWHDASYDVASCEGLRLDCQEAPADQLAFIVLRLITKGTQVNLHQGSSFSLVEEGKKGVSHSSRRQSCADVTPRACLERL